MSSMTAASKRNTKVITEGSEGVKAILSNIKPGANPLKITKRIVFCNSKA